MMLEFWSKRNTPSVRTMSSPSLPARIGSSRQVYQRTLSLPAAAISRHSFTNSISERVEEGTQGEYADGVIQIGLVDLIGVLSIRGLSAEVDSG